MSAWNKLRHGDMIFLTLNYADRTTKLVDSQISKAHQILRVSSELSKIKVTYNEIHLPALLFRLE